MRQVIYISDGLGGFVAEVPSLPGCRSQGKTISQASVTIRQAIIIYIENLQAQGQPIPEPTFLDVPKQEGVIVDNMLTRDDILHAAQAAFPNEDLQTVLDVLDNYGQLNDHERVQMAIIGLSQGSVDKLLTYVVAAIQDYRDVLSWYAVRFGKYP
jgi:predicted RNase H-like HicB family nuclease